MYFDIARDSLPAEYDSSILPPILQRDLIYKDHFKVSWFRDGIALK